MSNLQTYYVITGPHIQAAVSTFKALLLKKRLNE